MKKFVFALAAVAAMLLVSCSGNEETLKNMVGSWTDNDPEETTQIQFFPSEDGHTGRFIEERLLLVDEVDPDGIDINSRLTVYITGTYTLTDDARISYNYDIDNLSLEFSNEDLAAYTQRNIEYNDAHDNCWGYNGKEFSQIQLILENNLLNHYGPNWEEFYKSENEDFKSLAYNDVSCDGKLFVFYAGEGTRIEYTRLDEDLFEDAGIFDDLENNGDEEEE